MILNTLTAPFRFWRHLKYHREIIKHLRWSMADAQRIEFYKTLVRPSDLVFDVGANMGNRSKIFRAIGAKVIAFEPQSYCARFLTVAFSGDPEFILVQSALSDAEGEQTMHLSNAHVLSTLDTQWLNRISHGGRFSDQKWDRTEVVQVTTLDKSIQNFGVPDFIKIDVEGHEFNVLKGLTFPVNLLSLEFASESLDNIFKSIDHLDTLAQYDYRISLGESMKFEGSTWSDGPEIKALLAESMKHDPLVWGDIYAKCIR